MTSRPSVADGPFDATLCLIDESNKMRHLYRNGGATVVWVYYLNTKQGYFRTLAARRYKLKYRWNGEAQNGPR